MSEPESSFTIVFDTAQIEATKTLIWDQEAKLERVGPVLTTVLIPGGIISVIFYLFVITFLSKLLGVSEDTTIGSTIILSLVMSGLFVIMLLFLAYIQTNFLKDKIQYLNDRQRTNWNKLKDATNYQLELDKIYVTDEDIKNMVLNGKFSIPYIGKQFQITLLGTSTASVELN